MFVQILFQTVLPASAVQNAKNAMQPIILILVTAYPVLIGSKSVHHVRSKGVLSASKVTILVLDSAKPAPKHSSIVPHAIITNAQNANNIFIFKIRNALPVTFILNIVKNAAKMSAYAVTTSSISSKMIVLTAALKCPDVSLAHQWTNVRSVSVTSIFLKDQLALSVAILTTNAKLVLLQTNVPPASIIPPILIMETVFLAKILILTVNIVRPRIDASNVLLIISLLALKMVNVYNANKFFLIVQNVHQRRSVLLVSPINFIFKTIIVSPVPASILTVVNAK